MSMFWLIAVLSVWVVSTVVLLSAPRVLKVGLSVGYLLVVLLSAPRVLKVLGHRGLMGMILVMLSVQMLQDGSSN